MASTPVGMMRWLVAILLLVAISGKALLSGVYATGALVDGETGSFAMRMSRAMFGPLAVIPEPLQDRQIRDIKKRLDTVLHDYDSLADNSTYHPVLFVPGLISSQLETKLTNREKPHWWLNWLPDFICPKTTQTYDRTWGIRQTFFNILPYVIDCYVEELEVKWNFTEDGQGIPLPWTAGIDTRTKAGFESAMETDEHMKFFQYYADWLHQYLGYEADKQMIAQPWDWRVGPETWMKPGREFDQMKNSIEQVVEKNGGKGIVAVSISAGGPFLALFLNQLDQEWKDKNVHSWVSVSPALSGSVIAPMQFISLHHNSFMPSRIPSYITEAFGRIVSSTSSLTWLFPAQDSFRDPVILSPSKSYHANELGEALKDAGYPEKAKLYNNNRQYSGGTNLVPGVKTYCLSGYGMDTISRLKYNTSDLSDSPVFEIGDGDNCVTVEALRQCDAWADQQEAPVEATHYAGASHAGLMYDPRVIEKFFEVVIGKEEKEAKFALG